jgi:hypothetical protein
VFVCRKAFGRTRKRRPRISSSIASSPERSREGTFVISRRRVVHRPVHRAHLRERLERGDEALLVELTGRGDEDDERLPGVAALAHDEVAK